MPAITTALLAAGGLILGGVGMFNQQAALSKQQKDQEAAAASMSASAQAMNAAQVSEIGHEKDVQAQQRTQMDLDYNRSQLQTLRDYQKARSISLATATNQGVGVMSGSSALAGSYGNESGAAGTLRLANRQNYNIGNNIFDINAQISQDKIGLANAQTSYGAGQAQYNLAGAQGAAGAAMGAGMMSLGGAMISTAGTFGNLSKTASSSFNNAFSFGTGPGSWQNNQG